MGRSALLPAALLLGALAIGCGGGGGSHEVTPTGTPTRTPTSTPVPATQTPAGPPAELGYTLEPAVPSATFRQMLGLHVIPGAEDEALVLTQNGEIWRVPLEGSGEAVIFGDVSDLLIQPLGREEGLLGLAFSPDFEADASVYLYYSAGGPRRTVLSRFLVTNGALDLSSEQALLEVDQPFPNHKGGQLAFGPDGMLYVALGDGGAAGDPLGNGQDLSDLLGSILRIDVSGGAATYAVPPDNPFFDTPSAADEVFAYGFRNPWRFSFDRETGELWAGDVGQDRWEEVDRVVAGGNYGWSVMEGFECFQAAKCDSTGLERPRAAYGHEAGCSVTGGYVYRGEAMPELNGWYVYGDFCSGNIWALDTNDDDSPPVLLATTERSISSFAELPDGELVAVTYDRAIFRLVRAE